MTGGRPIFGQRWDAPIADEAELVDTPVGEACLWCDQPVAEGDRGFITPVVHADGTTQVRPAHLECELPAVFGGPAHLRGECTHVGSCQDGYDDRRELGLATLAVLNEQRAARGQGPL